ncbi:MAG TPA: ATP synthase F0 subunit B [Pyrinomonadaceae bacterium]|jgi:F0F1-type ATP synthase membrane subunit b/b'|nr:ATP synthase F0 subunit B [Pyrinomonadaceae bacterium]
MLAFFYNFLFLFASEAAHTTSAGGQTGWQQFLHFWENYMNIPGFELWKFINLGIFVLALYLLLRKPLSAGFKAKREQIRAELIKAQEERDAAMKKLQEVEGRLAMLDTEVAQIKDKAAADIETEKARIAGQTDSDIAKMREQAQNEIARAGLQARQELRKFSAEESIRLAEEMLRKKVGSDTDSKFVKTGIDNLGGLN